MPRELNIGAQLERSTANGPGIRYVIWLQGCPFRCPGCFNPEFQPDRPGIVVTPDALAERVLSVTGIEGVTYTGGEPMVQAEGLRDLSIILRGHGLSVVCYTGFTLEEVRRDQYPGTEELLALTDILIDGRYDETEKAGLPWRGSRNQRVHFLTGRYLDWKDRVDTPGAQMEMVVGMRGMVATGSLQDRVLKRLHELTGEGG